MPNLRPVLLSLLLVLLSPTLLSAGESAASDNDMLVAEINACGASLQSKAESLDSRIFSALASPLLVENSSAFTGLQCGTFPVWSPGRCVQTCTSCTSSSQCAPFAGRPQKCCSYCP